MELKYKCMYVVFNYQYTYNLNRGYMCNLLHAIYCRGAKITVQLF